MLINLLVVSINFIIDFTEMFKTACDFSCLQITCAFHNYVTVQVLVKKGHRDRLKTYERERERET